MRVASLLIATFLCGASSFGQEIDWKKLELLGEFVSEGASVADIDGDGAVDLVSGPYWWRGPDFSSRYEYRTAVTFEPKGYSDHFFSFTADLDRDGDADIIRVGFPGKEAVAHLNPGNATRSDRWPTKTIADQISNESPTLVDLIEGGQSELVCSRDGQFGYYAAGEDATEPWQWHGVSAMKVTHQPFGHGLGVGDVDGDGRLDLLGLTRWWRQPESASNDSLEASSAQWAEEVWALQGYGGGGAQILVEDLDRDGLNDILTSLNAHGYGLAWFAQKRGDGGRRFIRNDILGQSASENAFGVVFSQLHALALGDIDEDGFQDVITGKRYWAHGGNDPGGNDPPVLYWFSGEVGTDGQISFKPHLVDDQSGVGTEVVVHDMNSDGHLDLISSNKRGVAIHFQVRR